MKKETALSGSVQEKNGKLYAVIGYGDAIAAFTEQYEKECRGILSPEDCPSLEFLQSWLVNVKKPNVQKSTYDGYEELIERRIRTFFGDKLTLKDITPVRIQEFYASIRADGCKEKTVLEYHNLLHDACGWAVRQEILLSNPFEGGSSKAEKIQCLLLHPGASATADESRQRRASLPPGHPCRLLRSAA